MKASEAFSISEEQAEAIEELKDTFKDKSDLRAALEDYFHVYDDFAEMSEDEFDDGFKKFTQDMKSSEIESAANREVKSSTIGNIKDDFCLGKIKEPEALRQLAGVGKGKREAKKILEKWKENGIVKSSKNLKSSVDSVADDIADYFGTEAGEDNVIECDDIITHKDVVDIESLIEDEDDVNVKIGTYSVTVSEAPETIESSTNVYIDDDKVVVEKDGNQQEFGSEEETDNVVETEEPEEPEPENTNDEDAMPTGTSFKQINSEQDFIDYNVRIPKKYDFEDVKGMWWEVNGNDGASMREVIEREGDGEIFIVTDNERLFLDTAYNYVLDSEYELSDYGLTDDDFEEGKYIGK